MKVFEVMTPIVITIKKDSTILNAMKIMKDKDVGFLIIEEDNKPIGVITDRDIVLTLAKEISPNTNISKVMKKYVITVNLNEDISNASDIMGYMQVRRLVVVNDSEDIVGILSLTDLARCPLTDEIALETMIEISYTYPTKKVENDKIYQTNAFIF